MLSPRQLGQLANHVRQAVTRFPVPVPQLMEAEDIGEMETWEVWLRLQVSTDASLPDYDTMSEEIDFLVDYYAKT